MQTRQTFQIVPVRMITLAFALLTALLLSSAAGYLVRGWTTPRVATPPPITIVWVAPTPLPSHVNENRLPGNGDVTRDNQFGIGK